MSNKLSPKTMKKYMYLRRAIVTLSPYVSDMDIKMDKNDLVIEGTLLIRRLSKYLITIKPDKMTKRVINELLRIEPAMIGGNVKVEDVKIALLGIYAKSFSELKPYISDLRRVAGLFKDEKIRNFLIFRRIIAKKGKKAIRKAKVA